MSIQSMLAGRPLFLVPSSNTKPPTREANPFAPASTQRSGGLKPTDKELILPPLLTIKEGENIKHYKQRCWDYFIGTLCKLPLITSWADDVLLIPPKSNQGAQFKHITYQKPTWEESGQTTVPTEQEAFFSTKRASHLPWITLISSSSLNWYNVLQNGGKDSNSIVTNRMMGHVPNTDFVMILEIPKSKDPEVTLVSAYPADKNIERFLEYPPIKNAFKYIEDFKARFVPKKDKSQKRQYKRGNSFAV